MEPAQHTHPTMPTAAGIREAAERLRPFGIQPPLVYSPVLSRTLSADVWVKLETASPIASFKWRGALVEILRAREAGPVRRVVASSTGNHGQGVAYAASVLGITADIFVPRGANPVKLAAIAGFGASLHEVGDDLVAADGAAREYAHRHNALRIDDGDSLNVYEGAGTVGLEIASNLADIDIVFVPAGSGALAIGTAVAAKSVQPALRVVAVQASAAPALVNSYRTGMPVMSLADTIADGLVSAAITPATVKRLRLVIDDAILVTEDSILAALAALIEQVHVLVEPSAAAALAAVWSCRDLIAGRRIVLVLTGANITRSCLEAALARSSARDGTGTDAPTQSVTYT